MARIFITGSTEGLGRAAALALLEVSDVGFQDGLLDELTRLTEVLL